MQAVTTRKSMRGGEIGLIAVLAIMALACLYIAAKTIEPAFAFHMALGVVASAAGIFAIFQRYSVRPAGSPPLEIDGKPNYNFGPVKFTTLAALFWGVAGMAVGIYIAFELAFPWLNIAPWFNFGRLRPLHTSAVIFAFGGNVLLATSFYVVQRTCRARLAGDLAPWFVVLGYNFFIVIAGNGLSARHHPGQGIRRAGMVLGPLADHRLGRLSPGVPRHADAPQGAAHLRRQLVLSGLHPHHRDAAHRQQRVDADFAAVVEVGHPVGRRAGRDVPVVVRP